MGSRKVLGFREYPHTAGALFPGAGVGTFAGRTAVAAGLLRAGGFALAGFLGRGCGKCRSGFAQDARRQANIGFGLRRALRLLLGLLRLDISRLLLMRLVDGLVVALLVTLAIILIAAVVVVLWVLWTAAVILAVLSLLIVLLGIAALIVTLAVLLLEASVQDPVIVIGVLEVILGQHTVASRRRIARHGEKFFHQLLRVAARTGAAVKIGGALTATTTTTASASWTRFAVIAAALAVFHVVVVLVHQNNWLTFRRIPPPNIRPTHVMATVPQQHDLFSGVLTKRY